MLEVGPGTGYYTLDAAGWISSGGQLDIFDLQPEMLARSRPGADVVDVLTHEQLIHEAPAIVGRRTPSPLAPATTRAHGTRQTEPERDEPCWHCSACYGLPVS